MMIMISYRIIVFSTRTHFTFALICSVLRFCIILFRNQSLFASYAMLARPKKNQNSCPCLLVFRITIFMVNLRVMLPKNVALVIILVSSSLLHIL